MVKTRPSSKSKKKDNKIRLSKPQKIRAAQIIRLENRISVCREFTQLWSQFFAFFADEIHDRPIRPEEEKAFFKTVTDLSRKHFLFSELMGDTFERSDEITDVLVASVSLANVKAMDEGTYSKLELGWHSLLIDMYVALGRLLRLMPSGMKIDEMLAHAQAKVESDAAAGGSKGAAGGGKEKKRRGMFGKAKA